MHFCTHVHVVTFGRTLLVLLPFFSMADGDATSKLPLGRATAAFLTAGPGSPGESKRTLCTSGRTGIFLGEGGLLGEGVTATLVLFAAALFFLQLPLAP